MDGIVVGITGGTGTGKSALAGYLRRLGAAYYSVDGAAHSLYRRDPALAARLAGAFGPRVIAAGGGLDRRAIGAAAFASPQSLRRLDGIVHPALRREAAAAVARMRARHPVVVVEAGAILFDLGLDSRVDLLVVTICGRGERIRRLVRSGRLARAEAVRRLAVLRGVEARMLAAARRRRRVLTVGTSGPPAALVAAAAAIMDEARGAR